MSEPFPHDAAPHPLSPAHHRTGAAPAPLVQAPFDRAAPHYDRANGPPGAAA